MASVREAQMQSHVRKRGKGTLARCACRSSPAPRPTPSTRSFEEDGVHHPPVREARRLRLGN